MTGSEAATNKTQRIESRRAELDILSIELAEKELEYVTLQYELSAFQRRYAAIVGVLYVRLAEIEKDIAGGLYQKLPSDTYENGYRRAEQKERTTREKVNETLHQDEKKALIPSIELRELYRKVAKIVHPDFATHEEERELRSSLMARANTAYHNGDMVALKQILMEWESWQKGEVSHEKELDELQLLEKQIRQVKARITHMKARIAELKQSELYMLMQKVNQAAEQGIDLLAEMAMDLQQQICAAESLRDSIRS